MDNGRIKQVFLGWDRPLIDLAVERVATEEANPSLTEGNHAGILDYANILFFLPTSKSCRRFRRGITEYAAANSAVVFPGRIKSLSSLISDIENQDGVVNSSTSFLLWTDVLREAPLKELRSLFPLEIENQVDIKWRIGLAEKMFALQNRLGEAGLTIQDVTELETEEPERWQNLAALEGRFLSKLEQAGLEELNRSKRDFKDYSFPGVEKIIVAGVPDPIPILVEKLKVISEKIPIEIWIHAPERDSDKFDEFGRPIEQYWEKANIEIPDENLIHLEGTSRQQGEKVVEILKDLQNSQVPSSEFRVPSSKSETPCPMPHAPCSGINADDFAICIANEELYSDISYAFFKHGIYVYDPNGVKMSGMSVYHLLNNLFALVNKGDFESISQLIRNPDYLKYFIRKTEIENVQEIFTSVDKFLVDHMSTPIHSLPDFEKDQKEVNTPGNPEAHLGYEVKSQETSNNPGTPRPTSGTKLQTNNKTNILNCLTAEVKGLLADFKSADFFSFIRRFLSDVYDTIEFSPHTREEDHIFVSAASNVDRLLKELESPMTENIKKEELLEIFIKLLEKGTVYPEKFDEAIDLQGWLEISWEKAPNIIISGMNEGWLPESVVGDVFLPDSMLTKLGLNDNRKRFARDTYILHSLLQSRMPSSNFQDNSNANTPGTPSPSLASDHENEDIPPKTGERSFAPTSGTPKMESEGKTVQRSEGREDKSLSLSLSSLTPTGAVHMIVGKQNKSSDPVKPSRLLFKCDPERLVQRSEHLFADVPEDILDSIAEGPAWKLKKPELYADIKRISVTEFRNYLACPFRFYLRKCLGMEDVPYENNEMDARDFGTITHAVLEDFAQNAEMIECHEEKAIKEFLDKSMEERFNQKFGPKDERPLPIMVQYESLKQRLAKFAEIQAEEASKGWKIIGTEMRIGHEIDGIYISGMIDRVELNPRNGKVRILDYKTVDSGDINKLIPEKVHMKGANDDSPEHAVFEYDGKNKYWLDLQLPLYALLLREKEEFKGKELECGYFNLHKTISHTGIYIWENMETYLEAAEGTVKQVVDKVNKKEFWPPSDKVQYDNFERLMAGYNTLQDAFE